jgi:hypothetical protein
MWARSCVALVVIAGCHEHGPALPPIPGQGGPAWLELDSEHFTLWTDGSRAQGQRLIREMEHFRQVVLGVGFQSANAEGKSLVLALRDAEEVGVFIPAQFIAFAYTGGALFSPVIILPVDAPEDQLPTVTHELTHVISSSVIHHQPRWFAEGMANFFASVDLDPERATGDFGKPLDYIVARLKATAPKHVEEMFACTELRCMDDMFYATAWAMFAFLANVHPQELLQYAARLDQLPPEAMAQAWTDVFPTLTPEQFDKDLRDWLGHGKHTVWSFKVKLQDWPVAERPLRDADVHAARAVMRELFAKPGDAPPPELAAALAADPAHLLARLVEARYNKTIAVDDARRVTDAHPGDWRAWWLLGLAVSWHGDDARRAHDRACALIAAHKTGWTPTGWCK